jgi:hypothetical protein
LASRWAFQPCVGWFGLASVRVWLPYASGVRGGEAVTWHEQQTNSQAGCVHDGAHSLLSEVLWSWCMRGCVCSWSLALTQPSCQQVAGGKVRRKNSGGEPPMVRLLPHLAGLPHPLSSPTPPLTRTPHPCAAL